MELLLKWHGSALNIPNRTLKHMHKHISIRTIAYCSSVVALNSNSSTALTTIPTRPINSNPECFLDSTRLLFFRWDKKLPEPGAHPDPMAAVEGPAAMRDTGFRFVGSGVV